MKTFMIGLSLALTAATALSPILTTTAQAQSTVQNRDGDWRDGDRYRDRGDNRNRDRGRGRDEWRGNRADNDRGRDDWRKRDWRQYRNYDYNRPDGRDYYADRFYRDGRNYRPVRVTRQTRIYRGGNGRYYCRRSDGTTGLIAGAAIGGLLGNSLDNGRSSLLGTLIGAGGGALLGREIDRGGVNCR